MKIAKRREAGQILGRAGISDEIIKVCKRVAESENRKDAAKAAGEISVLFQACTFDEYWREKSIGGEWAMETKLLSIIEKASEAES